LAHREQRRHRRRRRLRERPPEQRSRRGQPLQAGEFVLLGSVVQTYWLTPGDEVKIINDPFGVVTFTLHA
jgi:2-keto-4-pentenoate hydratase